MATALAAVRLQPWQPDNVGEVHKESFKGSFKGRVRAFGGYPNKGVGNAQQQNRGKICRVPLFRTSSPRREALTSAMSEERDITDMQESNPKPNQLSPRERRRLRNERRQALQEEKGNWKEEVENKLDVKKKPPKGWEEILDINRLASKGYVWYMVSVPKKQEHVAAEQLHILFPERFPGLKYEVMAPSIPTFRKLKSGRYSDARQRLYPGCLLIKCVMNREVYNLIRSNPRIYDFFGTKAQGTSVSNMIIPAAVSMVEIDELFKRMEKAEAEFKVLKEEADRLADERERIEKEAILEAQAEGQVPPTKLERGALVRINIGPFINHTATVLDIDYDDDTVDLSVIIFGQPTNAKLRIDEVIVLEGARY